MENFKFRQYLCLAACFFIFTVYHCLVVVNFGDEVTYFEKILYCDIVMYPQKIIDYTILRWQWWTSRNFVELVLIIVCQLGYNVWKVIDVLVWVSAFHSIRKILHIEGEYLFQNFLLMCLFYLYPFEAMSSAGWVATTINYIWTLSAGLYALTVVDDYVEKRIISKSKSIIGIIAVAYASNHEQMCVVLLMALFIYLCKNYVRNNSSSYIYLNIFVCIVNLVNIVFCPGNRARLVAETTTWMPIFSKLNFLEKLDMGFVHFFNVITNYRAGILFLIFGFLIAWIFYHRKQKNLFCLSVIVTLFSIVRMLSCKFKVLGYLFGPLAEIHLVGLEISNILRTILCMISLGIGFYLIYRVFDNISSKWISILILGTGLAVTVVMGFSPTCYASGDRTMIFIYFAMIFVGGLIIKENWEAFDGKIFINCLVGIVTIIHIVRTINILS